MAEAFDEAKADKFLRDTYAKLTPWQKTQVARHPERPHFKDYVAGLFDEFVPLAGDRAFADDQAGAGDYDTAAVDDGGFGGDDDSWA